MKIMMIPGERNEELILKVREATATFLNDDNMENEEYFDVIDTFIDEYGTDAVYDALYYNCENKEEMLQDQADYFCYLLFNDEVKYYISRMVGIDV